MRNNFRFFIIATSLIVVILLFPASAKAASILYTDAIQAGQVIDQDVFLVADEPVIEGTVNGDVFIVGSNVTISGNVNGSIFVIAQSLSISGEINGNLFAAAVNINQLDGGEITRNLYGVALNLTTEEGSSIGRDLFTVAISARLSGETERDTNAIIGAWQLFQIIRDVIDNNLIGLVPDQPPSTIANIRYISYPNSSPHLARIISGQLSESSEFPDWILTALLSLLNFLIVGSLMLWIFPRRSQAWIAKIQNRPLASAGYGSLVLINGYLLPVLVLILLIGLLLGLIYLSLPSLAWMVFFTGLGLLMSLFSLFLIATIYLSKAIVAYLAGTLILSLFAKKVLKYKIIPLLLGLIIYVLLASIPYMGSFIGLVVTLLGLGSIWLTLRQPLDPVVFSDDTESE